jgi:hypothetical protein
MPGIEVWTLGFVCGICSSPIHVRVQNSPETTVDELADRKFDLDCRQPGCEWTGSKYGREAFFISAPQAIPADSKI